MIFALAGFALLFWAISLGGHWAIARHARRWLTGSAAADSNAGAASVSILKTISGHFPLLEANLSSYFAQHYPSFEIQLAGMNEEDTGVEIARRVAARFSVPHQFVLGGEGAATNPKIRNVLPAFRKARYDWIWMSDDNTIVDPGRLNSLMAQAGDTDLGMLSAILCARDGSGFWGRLEAMTVNTFYARGMVAAHFAGRPSPQGKLMLFRKSVVEKFGGLAAVGDFPDDDLRLGAEIRKLGLKIEIDHEPIVQRVGRLDSSTYWRRHIRWAVIHKRGAPLSFWIQPLFSGLVTGALGAWGTSVWFPDGVAAFACFHAALWFLGDVWLLARLDPRLSATGYGAWVLRQFTVLTIWFLAAGTNRITWRAGQHFRMRRDGRMVPLPGHQKTS